MAAFVVVNAVPVVQGPVILISLKLLLLTLCNTIAGSDVLDVAIVNPDSVTCIACVSVVLELSSA